MRLFVVLAVLMAMCAACGSNTAAPTFEERLEDSRTGLTWILERSYEFDRSKVESVDCPTNPDIAPGSVFTCHLRLRDAGGVRAVDITMAENESYRIGRPRVV